MHLVHEESGQEWDLMNAYGNWVFAGAPHSSAFKNRTKEGVIAHYLSMNNGYSIRLNGEILEIGQSAKDWWNYKD